MTKTICTCCMGMGFHEEYHPKVDRWDGYECIACEGTGYITPERSEELQKLVKGGEYGRTKEGV